MVTFSDRAHNQFEHAVCEILHVFPELLVSSVSALMSPANCLQLHSDIHPCDAVTCDAVT